MREVYKAEVTQMIPQYSFEKNTYFIEREGRRFEHADISAFFLPEPISDLLRSGREKITVPILYFVCLCRDHIV